MQFIIHIGTHKTGTSSLQRFLLANKECLLSHGVFYGHGPASKNVNFLAGHTAYGRDEQVRQFINKVIKQARNRGADTIILSGESFYAMSCFIFPTRWTHLRGAAYWESEQQAVQRLQTMFPADIQPRIVCYFRRQDYFLESIYNQRVKATNVSGTINMFRDRMSECLDYVAHIDIWADAFSADNMQLRSYDAITNDINEDFLKNILGIQQANEFELKDLRVNDRLSRDVLEYKRILNRLELSPVDRRMNNVALVPISRSMGDINEYQDFLTHEERLELLTRHDADNKRLQSTYHMPALLEFDNDYSRSSQVYHGLSVDKAIEIMYRHIDVKQSLAYRVEYLALNVTHSLRSKGIVFRFMVSLARRLGGRNLLKYMRKKCK